MKYAAIYKNIFYIPDCQYNASSAHEYDTISEFSNEEAMIDWVKQNKGTKLRLIKYSEVYVEEKITFTVKPAH